MLTTAVVLFNIRLNPIIELSIKMLCCILISLSYQKPAFRMSSIKLSFYFKCVPIEFGHIIMFLNIGLSDDSCPITCSTAANLFLEAGRNGHQLNKQANKQTPAKFPYISFFYHVKSVLIK